MRESERGRDRESEEKNNHHLDWSAHEESRLCFLCVLCFTCACGVVQVSLVLALVIPRALGFVLRRGIVS